VGGEVGDTVRWSTCTGVATGACEIFFRMALFLVSVKAGLGGLVGLGVGEYVGGDVGLGVIVGEGRGVGKLVGLEVVTSGVEIFVGMGVGKFVG